MKSRTLIFLAVIALAVLLLVLVLMYFFKWKKEGSKMLPNKSEGASSIDMRNVEGKVPTVSRDAQEHIVIDHMTLEDTLRVLKSDSLLSDLDNDLKNVKEGRKTIEDHKEYFKTQVDKKLKQLSFMYSPNSPGWHSIPEEERPKAQAMQAKLNGVRRILKHFNEDFSQYDDFKYGYFSKVRVDFLSNEDTLKRISHDTLNKLGELSHIKYKKLVPNLNEFLKSSQASIKGFISNNVDHFQKEKDNAERYFRNYSIGYKELLAKLELFYELCKKDGCMEPIAAQMLNECKIQDKILTEADDFLNQSQFNFGRLINCECPYCTRDKQSYEQADKNLTLPFIEYIDVLAICNEIVSSETIYKTVADSEVIRDLNDLLSLHTLSHYLVTYYCYGNEGNGKLAAELLHINSLGKEHALQLLVQLIDVYSNCLEKEFQPEKDFYEKVAEVQMKFWRTMKNLCDEFCKDLRQYREQLYKVNSERNKIILEACEKIHKQDSEFYEQASESCRQASESCRRTAESFEEHSKLQKAANAKRQEQVKELLKIVQEQLNKPSSSQQQPENQADDQPGPSSKLSETPPISRSQSLSSLNSNDSDVEVTSRSQCR